MFVDPLINLSLAACFGLQLVLSLVLLPLASHARGALADVFFRELLPRVLLLGVCVAALAALLLIWRDGAATLLVSCVLFLALGHGLARHMLRLRTVVAQAQADPQRVLKPIQFLASAQLAVAMVSILYTP
ncbi:MAG: hypothetical protein ABF296_07975 [Oceanococcaceae bacterium]